MPTDTAGRCGLLGARFRCHLCRRCRVRRVLRRKASQMKDESRRRAGPWAWESSSFSISSSLSIPRSFFAPLIPPSFPEFASLLVSQHGDRRPRTFYPSRSLPFLPPTIHHLHPSSSPLPACVAIAPPFANKSSRALPISDASHCTTRAPSTVDPRATCAPARPCIDLTHRPTLPASGVRTSAPPTKSTNPLETGPAVRSTAV